MITGVGGASIWSEDLNNLLPFYRDILGLTPSTETDGFVILGTQGGATLALGTHSEVRGANMDPARHMISLMSNDVRGDYARLKGVGVEFVDEPTDFGPVTVATCRDPEGNYVQLIQQA